jgi:CRISPR-associated protein Cas2
MIRKRYLFSYDITDDKRRTKVFKTLTGQGDHVQYSVFLCDLNDKELQVVIGRLSELINTREDQILVFDMGSTERELDRFVTTIGQDLEVAQRVQII